MWSDDWRTVCCICDVYSGCVGYSVAVLVRYDNIIAIEMKIPSNLSGRISLIRVCAEVARETMSQMYRYDPLLGGTAAAVEPGGGAPTYLLLRYKKW